MRWQYFVNVTVCLKLSKQYNFAPAKTSLYIFFLCFCNYWQLASHFSWLSRINPHRSVCFLLCHRASRFINRNQRINADGICLYVYNISQHINTRIHIYLPQSCINLMSAASSHYQDNLLLFQTSTNSEWCWAYVHPSTDISLFIMGQKWPLCKALALLK